MAIFAFGMPAGQALLAASEGAAFGLFPIIWIVLTAIWIFRMTELTGYDLVLRRAFGSLSPDQRIQAIIIAFCFGALLEALAGFGTPVAVTAVMLIAVGITPDQGRVGRAGRQHRAGRVRRDRGPDHHPGQDHRAGPEPARRHGRPADPDPGGLRPADPGADGRRHAAASGRPGSPPLVGGVGFGVAQFLCSNFFSYQVADIIAALAGALAMVLLLRVWQPSRDRLRREVSSSRSAGSRSVPPDRPVRPARHRRRFWNRR